MQPTPRRHIVSTWITCSGNIMWLLLYPWQWTPTDALNLGSSDGLINMHGWGLSSSLIGPVSSWHGLWLTPAENPAGYALPSHHTHACCIPHDWPRTLSPRDHAPTHWMSVPQCIIRAAISLRSCHTFLIEKIWICSRIHASANKRHFLGCLTLLQTMDKLL